MPYVIKPFDKYVLYYISPSGSGPQVGVPQLAEIDCFNKREGRAGIIYFFPDGTNLPQNTSTINGIYIYFHLSCFNDVITILREEKPLNLAFNEEKKIAYIQTSTEPIGERERT
jgi:hypothetical protein